MTLDSCPALDVGRVLPVSLNWVKVEGGPGSVGPRTTFEVPYTRAVERTLRGLCVSASVVLYEQKKHVATVVDREVSTRPATPREGLLRLLGAGDPITRRLDVAHEHYTVETLLGHAPPPGARSMEVGMCGPASAAREVFEAQRYAAVTYVEETSPSAASFAWDVSQGQLAELILQRIAGGVVQTTDLRMDPPPPPQGMHALVRKWLGNPGWARVLWSPTEETGKKTVVHQEVSARIPNFDNKRPYGHYLEVCVGDRPTGVARGEALSEVRAFYDKAFDRSYDPARAWREMSPLAIERWMR